MDLFPLSLVLLVNLVLHSPLSLLLHHQPIQCCCRLLLNSQPTWEVTNSDGSVSLSLVLSVNLVLPSPRSLRSHHQPHLVLLPMLLLNSQPHGKSLTVMDLFPLSSVLLVNLVLHSPLSLRSHHQPPHLISLRIHNHMGSNQQ